MQNPELQQMQAVLGILIRGLVVNSVLTEAQVRELFDRAFGAVPTSFGDTVLNSLREVALPGDV